MGLLLHPSAIDDVRALIEYNALPVAGRLEVDRAIADGHARDAAQLLARTHPSLARALDREDARRRGAVGPMPISTPRSVRASGTPTSSPADAGGGPSTTMTVLRIGAVAALVIGGWYLYEHREELFGRPSTPRAVGTRDMGRAAELYREGVRAGRAYAPLGPDEDLTVDAAVDAYVERGAEIVHAGRGADDPWVLAAGDDLVAIGGDSVGNHAEAVRIGSSDA